ncbi:MAG: hypothetical protein RL766_1599 [Bacteroidota bacterium]
MSDSYGQLQHPPFFQGYVNLSGTAELSDLLTLSLSELEKDMITLKDANFDFAYEDGKWTIAQMLQHCIDTEMIFAYRALCIARNDKRQIRSFDENEYAQESLNNYETESLMNSMLTVRRTSLYLFNSFNKEWLERSALTDLNQSISVRALGHIIIGHWRHHKNVLTNRYGIQFSQ